MTYELAFLPAALDEWKKLDGSVKAVFKKKLAERLEQPHVPSAKLHSQKDRYKIKLRDAGYRLVYEVQDEIVTVLCWSWPSANGSARRSTGPLRSDELGHCAGLIPVPPEPHGHHPARFGVQCRRAESPLFPLLSST